MPERVPLMPVRPSCHASDLCLPCLGIILRTFLEHLVLFWGGLPLGEVVKKRRSVRKRRILRDSSVRTFLYNNNPFKSDELLRSKIGISLFATVEEEAKDCTNCINKRTLHFPLIQ